MRADPYGAIRNGEGPGIAKRTLPMGTVTLRSDLVNGKRQLTRMIKIRMDGPPQGRWMLYARWWWLKNKGPVPPGMRVIHMDGNELNDAPGNIAVGSPGDVISMAHMRDPEMSRANREACRTATSEHNRFAGKLRRLRAVLMGYWYPVWDQEGVIFNVPFRKRKQLLAWFGADVSGYPANGRARIFLEQLQCVVRAVRGRDLKAGILDTYDRVDPEFQVSTGKDNFSAKEDRRMDALSKADVWTRAEEAAKKDLRERK